MATAADIEDTDVSRERLIREHFRRSGQRSSGHHRAQRPPQDQDFEMTQLARHPSESELLTQKFVNEVTNLANKDISQMASMGSDMSRSSPQLSRHAPSHASMPGHAPRPHPLTCRI